mgnify:CR=1 FL=1
MDKRKKTLKKLKIKNNESLFMGFAVFIEILLEDNLREIVKAEIPDLKIMYSRQFLPVKI